MRILTSALALIAVASSGAHGHSDDAALHDARLFPDAAASMTGSALSGEFHPGYAAQQLRQLSIDGPALSAAMPVTLLEEQADPPRNRFGGDLNRRREHSSREEFRNDYRWPTSSGTSERFQFADGSHFTLQIPKHGDKIFGMYGDHLSPLAQRMSFIDMDPQSMPGAMQIVRNQMNKFAAAYPFAGPGGKGVGSYLRDIYLVYDLRISGGGAEGVFFYEPGDSLYLAKPRDNYIEKRFLATAHHELAHLLEENLVGEGNKSPTALSWRKRWFEALPDGFIYTPTNYARPTYWFTPQSYNLGFLTGYNRASPNEDFAVFGAHLVMGHPEVWECAKYALCKKKLDLVIEVYGMLSPKYTLEYFQQLKRTAEINNEHEIITPDTPVAFDDPFGSDEVRFIDESPEAYVNKASALDRVPRKFPDGAPKFSGPPTVVNIGGDAVNVHMETQPGMKVYGETEMSRQKQDVYVPLKQDELTRTRAVVDAWAELFPFGFQGVLKDVICVGGFNTDGLRGVFYPDPGNALWLGPKISKLDAFRGHTTWSEAMTLSWATTLTHESIHLIAYQYYTNMLSESEGVAWRRRWILTHPHGFEYFGQGAPDSGLDFTPKFYKDGFISGYSRVSLDEDIAQTATALVMGDSHLWDCVAVSPICAKKVDLLIEMFRVVNPRYSKDFFLARGRGESVTPGNEDAVIQDHGRAKPRVEREIENEIRIEDASTSDPKIIAEGEAETEGETEKRGGLYGRRRRRRRGGRRNIEPAAPVAPNGIRLVGEVTDGTRLSRQDAELFAGEIEEK